MHPDVASIEDDHPLSAKNVKSWIKTNQDHLKSIKHYARSKERNERREYQIVSTYVKNLKDYLRTGVYMDHRWGEKGDKNISHICYARAYDNEGNVKRNVGTWYKDVGLWTKDMDCKHDGT